MKLSRSQNEADSSSFRSTLLTLHDAAARADSLHGLPLFILTRDGVSAPEEKIQAGYLRLSSHPHREVATGFGHFIQLDNPKLVIAAVHQVIAEADWPKRLTHSTAALKSTM